MPLGTWVSALLMWPHSQWHTFWANFWLSIWFVARTYLITARRAKRRIWASWHSTWKPILLVYSIGMWRSCSCTWRPSTRPRITNSTKWCCGTRFCCAARMRRSISKTWIPNTISGMTATVWSECGFALHCGCRVWLGRSMQLIETNTHKINRSSTFTFAGHTKMSRWRCHGISYRMRAFCQVSWPTIVIRSLSPKSISRHHFRHINWICTIQANFI